MLPKVVTVDIVLISLSIEWELNLLGCGDLPNLWAGHLGCNVSFVFFKHKYNRSRSCEYLNHSELNHTAESQKLRSNCTENWVAGP